MVVDQVGPGDQVGPAGLVAPAVKEAVLAVKVVGREDLEVEVAPRVDRVDRDRPARVELDQSARCVLNDVSNTKIMWPSGRLDVVTPWTLRGL